MTFPILSQNQVATPTAGYYNLFYDKDNNNILTAKDSAGTFQVVGQLPDIDTAKLDDCICEVLSSTTNKLACGVERGVITPAELESYVNSFNIFSTVTYDPSTGSYTHGMTSSPTLFTQLTVTNVLCNGDSTGTASITVQGGTAPYTITYTDMADNPVNNAALAAGAYKVTVADANGVTKVVTFIVTEPAALALSTVVSGTSPTAEATALPSGGTEPYTYVWKDNGGVPIGQTTQTATGLSSGTYQVEVTDANGCTIEDTNVVIP